MELIIPKKFTAMKKKLLFVAALLTFSQVNAQFQRSYGIQALETGQSVQLTRDSGYIVAGYTRQPYIGNGEATLMKTDKNGTPLWIKVYGHKEFDFFNSVREVNLFGAAPIRKAPDYVATGHTQSFGFGSNDVYLVGTTANGFPIFSKTFGGKESDIGYCVQVVDDAIYGPGYVIVGETNSFPHLFPGTNVYVIRTDIIGNLISSVVIGTPGNDQGFWIEQTKDGGYIIAGTTTLSCNSSFTPNKDIFAIRLKPDLSIMWTRIIGGGISKNDVANCVRENEDGSFIFTGITESFGVGEGDAFLLNLDAVGNFLWMKTYGNKRLDQGQCLLNSTYGVKGYVVSGFTNVSTSSLANNYDAYLFRTDDLGNLLWTNRYGSVQNDFGYELSRSEVPGFAFTGRESSFGAGGFDIYLVETDINGKSASGCQRDTSQKEIKISPCITKGAQYVYVDPELTVQSIYLDVQYIVHKCATFLPAEQAGDTENDKETNLNLRSGIKVTPNPVSTKLNVAFNKDYVGGVLKMYDYQGRMILEKQLEQNNIDLQLDQLPNGIYFLTLSNIDLVTESTRFIKQ
jgi:hypothetical protein